MTKDEAMDLALEALEYIENNYMSLPKSGSEAITAIKQARSAPVQEPVFCEYCGGNDDADFGLPTDHCTDCARPQPAAQRQWVGLMQGVRVEREYVVVSVHGGNRAARELCAALIQEMNT